MFRIRAIIIIITLAVIAYSLSPAHRKERIKGKFREVLYATTFAIILYWIYMLAAYLWEHGKGT
jgi:uncharacterized membrane protein (GlpM family)